MVDDTLLFTDYGGEPSMGEIQYWLFRSGLGYLPQVTNDTETFEDPTGDPW